MIILNQAAIIMISRRKKGVGCQENHHHCHNGDAPSADVILRNPEGRHCQLSIVTIVAIVIITFCHYFCGFKIIHY